MFRNRLIQIIFLLIISCLVASIPSAPALHLPASLGSTSNDIYGRKDHPSNRPGGTVQSISKAMLNARQDSDSKGMVPFPGVEFFQSAPNDIIIEQMGRRLVEEGCSAYKSGPSKQWTEADRSSYQLWQEKLGYTGTDADGWPGKKSWDALQVPQAATGAKNETEADYDRLKCSGRCRVPSTA
ncbi:hypothetical protein FQN57_003067 [Myotisia sp. PD_48]|nr:hypothetical protein FQN57_003067 [Myotisia sp. PD_48]